MNAECASDFAFLDAMPREISADELPVFALDDMQTVVEEDCFRIGADEPHAVPHAAALQSGQAAMVFAQPGNRLDNTKAVLETFSVCEDKRAARAHRTEC